MLRKNNSNIIYMIKEWVGVSKANFAVAIIRIPVELLLPMIMVLIPKILIDAITKGVSDSTMLLTVGLLTSALVLLSVVQPYFQGKLNKGCFVYGLHFSMLGLKKMLGMNYEKLESFDGRRKYERAKAFCDMDKNSDIWAGMFVWSFSQCLSTVCGIFTYAVLFAVLQPYIVIILLFSGIVEFLVVRRINTAITVSRDERAGIQTKLEYFYRVATEPKSGKDIRLYGLSDWFCMTLAKLTALMMTVYNKLFKKTIKLTFGQAAAIILRDAAAYGFMIYFAVQGKMSLADFIMYFGLLIGCSAWITGLGGSLNTLKRLSIECQRFRDFMAEEEDDNDIALPFVGEVESIEFKDVCFSYNKTEDLALKNISFKININDRIAIVGENGAGKTTLIKLMCGLYKPTGGEILINGINVCDSIGTRYFELFSTVFQDFYFLPLTLLENISMQTVDKSDMDKALNCLDKAGLKDKISNLPDGLMSKLIKQVWENAVEFSGGEQQRLLLAKALYKDAPILILDEPTSALDPIAEQNIYDRYQVFSEDKISIFISHRLASTQFCSQVYFMSGGEIIEKGSHEELLMAKGKYWRMFEAQSYYYKHVDGNSEGGVSGQD